MCFNKSFKKESLNNIQDQRCLLEILNYLNRPWFHNVNFNVKYVKIVLEFRLSYFVQVSINDKRFKSALVKFSRFKQSSNIRRKFTSVNNF